MTAPPKIHVLKSQPLVPQYITVFGGKVFNKVAELT